MYSPTYLHNNPLSLIAPYQRRLQNYRLYYRFFPTNICKDLEKNDTEIAPEYETLM